MKKEARRILSIKDITVGNIFTDKCQLSEAERELVFKSYGEYKTFMRIGDITPYERNPRLNDDAVAGVADSIRDYGFDQPIVVDVSNVIVVGHTRRLSCLELGIQIVPVLVASHLSPDKVRMYRIADNKTGELSSWEFAKLKDEVGEMQDEGIDIGRLGFGKDELERILADGNDEEGNPGPMEDDEDDDDGIDETVEEDGDPEAAYDSVKGGIYQLGAHRLVCGDCTEGLDIASLFTDDGEKLARLWLTDPPYNVNYSGRANMSKADYEKSGRKWSKALRNNALTLANDNMGEDEFAEFAGKAFANCLAYMEPGASYYVFHAHTIAHVFRAALLSNGAVLSNQLIWIKNNFALGWGDYFMKHEPIYFGWKEGAKHNWYGRHDSTTTTFQKWPIVQSSSLHPSMKPLPMLEYFIRNSSVKGDIVLDTFGGSGSTLVACENTGRVCRMMEIMPKYCDVIRKRWAEEVHGKDCDWQSLTPKIGQVGGKA